jgi:hypothetical protein
MSGTAGFWIPVAIVGLLVLVCVLNAVMRRS